MTVTLEKLNLWLRAASETEHLEFKEARTRFETEKLMQYCAAIANEGGGFLVLGVSDSVPRNVLGTSAFHDEASLNRIKREIVDQLSIRVDVTELRHENGRVLVFCIPSRPRGQAVPFNGAYWMRSGDSLKVMTQDMLKRIHSEGEPYWLIEKAVLDISADEVISLLDAQAYFDLLNIPYPTSRDAVLERLSSEELIGKTDQGYFITNLAAVLLAKRLDAFPLSIARKAPRVVIYDGVNKLRTKLDRPGNRGYAVGFEGLIDFVHGSAPQNHIVEQTVREEVKMFPKQALRELIANAMVHQDFEVTGTSMMIEMYDDRIEVSNPGRPPIQVDRFIDEYRSRNEQLADLMRRLGICEEKGSGVDKVVHAAEAYQLPAPDFRATGDKTSAVLFAHQDFNRMSKADRIRACYQHCCLMYVSNQRMSNQSLRNRFGLPETAVATVSLVIGHTKDAGLIKLDESETSSTRYARYLPYWA